MDIERLEEYREGNQLEAKSIAIGGGISDPRNGTVLKIFSLINYGERAGSGLNSIFYENYSNHSLMILFRGRSDIQDNKNVKQN